MKIALIADIHGNTLALDAVLEDIAKHQPDIYLCLGDVVDGPDPSGSIERVTALPNVQCILGNTDRYIMQQEEPAELTAAAALEAPALLPKFQQATASFAWSRGYLCATGWYDTLFEWALEWRITLPDGRNLLAVHASPGLSDGPGIAPYTTDEQIGQLLRGCDEQIICVGHTHLPFVREFDDRLLINPGSVGNPLVAEQRACYAILTATADRVDVELKQIAYDNLQFIEMTQKSQHPATTFIVDHQLGKKTVEGQKISAAARWFMVEERNRSL